MIDQKETIFTGGSGLLGGRIQKRLPEASYPSHKEFDVRDYAGMERYISSRKFTLFVHAAALTSPPVVKEAPLEALKTNISGTANVVALCMQRGIKLVYISTDYVFRGDKGGYKEEDPVYPVNKYAWSKLGGECAVRLYDNSLIIRTSFGPDRFPFEKAFIDQWTSREGAGAIAEKIVKLIKINPKGTFHIGGPRRTVYEYAKSLSPEKAIGKLSIDDAAFNAPRDTSLDCGKSDKLFKENS
ncbi:SDR family oxidoreductase [Candidatus Omnitrophota bacterium]